jgi:short-chain fatty acids transporter
MTGPAAQPTLTPTQHPDTWLERFAQLMARLVPDAISASVVLTIIMAGVAFALGNPFSQVMEAYHRGLWMLLPFTMQMTLIIVLSAALAGTPFFRKAIARLARLSKTRNQVIATAFLAAGASAYLYWGLGYALGPLIAIYCATEAERKGIQIDFPFLLAVTSSAQSVWQFGLSSSGPLLMATKGHFLENITGVIPLSTTIWSPAAIIHEITFAVAAIVIGCRLMPRHGRPISQFPESFKLAKPPAPVAVEPEEPRIGFSERLERNPIISMALCTILAFWLSHHFFAKRLSLDINSLNATLLFLTFLLHRNVKRFVHAVQYGVGASWAVIVLYHLYAGVAGLIQYTNVGERAATMAASIATTSTFPLITAVAGALFAFFIPSSGGQWTIQGFVIVKAAQGVGVSVQRGMLALGVGDHMGNLTTPFWYVVIAGIARLDFRTFFGYGLVFAALWFAIGVVVFTFAPC